ncbi:MAG: hypothetical protein L0Y54_10050 [Sporichthyaceae bacterium]|nr:hypothetical protein [Sporichthyaceae bacterium]
MSRAARVMVWGCMAVASVVLAGCDPVTTPRPARSTPITAPDPEATLPAGFGWAGGPENGLRLGVPADWVQFAPSSESLVERHGIVVLDAKGAEDLDDYEAHLIASCGPNPGLVDAAAVARDAPRRVGDRQHLDVSAVRRNGRQLVMVTYDDETPTGRERWYEYVFLARGDRLCLISLTTPLPDGPALERLELTFEQIGGTIEVLPAPS